MIVDCEFDKARNRGGFESCFRSSQTEPSGSAVADPNSDGDAFIMQMKATMLDLCKTPAKPKSVASAGAAPVSNNLARRLHQRRRLEVLSSRQLTFVFFLLLSLCCPFYPCLFPSLPFPSSSRTSGCSALFPYPSRNECSSPTEFLAECHPHPANPRFRQQAVI